jgi:hypothetical protein
MLEEIKKALSEIDDYSRSTYEWCKGPAGLAIAEAVLGKDFTVPPPEQIMRENYPGLPTKDVLLKAARQYSETLLSVAEVMNEN